MPELQIKNLTGTLSGVEQVTGNITKVKALDGRITAPREGVPGATFTPHVSKEGIISWTNDRELDNQEEVNIRGPEGPEGKAFTYDMFTPEQLEALTGPIGPEGAPGPQGISGVHYGTQEPEDESTVWIDPSGETSNLVTKEEAQQMIDIAIAAIIDGDEVSY